MLKIYYVVSSAAKKGDPRDFPKIKRYLSSGIDCIDDLKLQLWTDNTILNAGRAIKEFLEWIDPTIVVHAHSTIKGILNKKLSKGNNKISVVISGLNRSGKDPYFDIVLKNLKKYEHYNH